MVAMLCHFDTEHAHVRERWQILINRILTLAHLLRIKTLLLSLEAACETRYLRIVATLFFKAVSAVIVTLVNEGALVICTAFAARHNLIGVHLNDCAA